MNAQTQVNQAQVLKIQELFQDSGAAYERNEIIEIANAQVIRRKCWEPYWDERVCHTEIMPTGVPAFIAMWLYRSVDTSIEYDEYRLYYFDGEKWHVIYMPNDYTWY